MTEETATREELADALEDAAAWSLEMFRSVAESVTVDGRIVQAEDEVFIEARRADLKHWYSLLRRAGKDIGEIPELERSGS